MHAVDLFHLSLAYPDAADLADILQGDTSRWANATASKSTYEGKGPFESARPSFALFLKYLSSDRDILHVSSHV